MSHIPLPSGIARKLPVPTSTSSSAMKPPATSSLKSVGPKRARGASTDLEDGLAAKRPKPLGIAKASTNLSKSMLNLAKGKPSVGQPLSIRKPVAIGRPISVRSGPAARSAMSDRTNTSRVNPSAPEKKPEASGKPTRRPEWDIKGRLEAMEDAYAETCKRVSTLENLNQILQVDNKNKETVVLTNTEELETARGEIRKLKSEVYGKEDELRQKAKEAIDLAETISNLEKKVRAKEDELSVKQTELAGLRKTVAEITSAAAGIEAKLTTYQLELEKSKKRNVELEALTLEQKETIENYQEKERIFETERRRLHNTILELKGNIRVFCRIRPLLGSETEKFTDIKHININSDKSLDIVKQNESSTGSGSNGKTEKFQFEFDHVFGHNANQTTVFEEISQLVQSAIDGYNVCIFAYGQTGSGKTFTMEGGDESSNRGIIPRTIEKIYEETRSLVEKGWSYKMEASFLEIYNEEIRDLLATEKGLKYEIKKVDSKSNDIYVSNLKVEDVTTGSTILSLLNRAKKNRIVAATNCNERSSRSHSVFMLKICGQNSITSETCCGTLNLVDLAGSERLKDSGSTGVRLEETKNINSSLSNLSKVIMALASNKDGHIPYRDSKLTHLLMNSLGGNSKTLMFVNLSPREDFLNETLNSLRFAKRVNQCQIGTATKKVQPTS